MKKLLFVLCILIASPAFAQSLGIKKPQPSIALPEDNQAPQEEKTLQVTPPVDTSVTVAPPACDFQITFPGEPYKSRKCPDGATGKCYELTRYTMVYDLSTTVDVRFSCNPMTQTQFEQYTEEVTRMALNGMAARSNVSESVTNFSQENDVRRTTLTGSGMSGRQNKVYIAQLWLSPHSILTLEAELIGDEHGTADEVFGDILRSLKVKDAPVAEAPPAAPQAATPALESAPAAP